MIDTNDGRTLVMKRDTDVKFADVFSGNLGMKMMVLLGGCPDSYIAMPMMILQNASSSNHIKSVPDNIPGVCYRFGPNGWMYRRVFVEGLSEKTIFNFLPNNRKRVLFVDNAGSQAISDEVKNDLIRSNTEIRFLPKNFTDLCQPADSFVIQKIKAAWRRIWDEKRMHMIEGNVWTDWKKGSGKLPNPGKSFFLQLARDTISEVNSLRDEKGVLYSRKSMMGCGMARSLNGMWDVRQLFPELPEILKKYRDKFDGRPVEDSLRLDGAVTESDSE